MGDMINVRVSKEDSNDRVKWKYGAKVALPKQFDEKRRIKRCDKNILLAKKKSTSKIFYKNNSNIYEIIFKISKRLFHFIYYFELLIKNIYY